ncbi:hypothetical protein DRN75_00790 [Nanoarchaeota archaeon]|nr:MAG: hypothetical protein DRN75_00790 [Nanoarchaeota archaeon]
MPKKYVLRNKIVKERLKELGGDQVIEVCKIILSKRLKKANEFEIAEKMKLKVNKVRAILYKLHAKKVVTYTRKRDKRKGWYIYIWSLKPRDIVKFAMNETYNEIRAIEREIREYKEGKEFYICEDCGVRVRLIEAMKQMFTCNYCGEPLKKEDTESKIKQAEARIRNLESQLYKLKKLMKEV